MRLNKTRCHILTIFLVRTFLSPLSRISQKIISKSDFGFINGLQGNSCALQHSCLCLENFKKELLTSCMNDTELRRLHTEACDMYRLFCDPSAQDHVHMGEDLRQEFKQCKLYSINICSVA